MTNVNINNDFFDFINHESLFYNINLYHDDNMEVKWKKLSPGDYIMTPDIRNKIILRVHKTKNNKYFLDSFQNSTGTGILWRGFSMGKITHYEIEHIMENNCLFDIVFYFDNDEKLIIHHITQETIFLLQDFFYGFIA